MRRLLGTLTQVLAVGLALSLTLGACGEDSPAGEDSRGTDTPTETSTPEPEPEVEPEPEPDVEVEVIRIVSQTAAGGEIGASALRIDQPAGMAELVRGFRTPELAVKIRRVVEKAELATGQALYGQVIAIGCDVPPSASAAVDGDAVMITAGKVVNPLPECFAPVTSVAIARVDLPLG
jgi:hypothetical protein